ncbi:hypothetical protein BDW74DRAFT_174044 [Aspergillus multicolor]|uniref:uncharacterized protein n=1 Tax=Aspergillus multicolor TaxID=41759 RepID=UPI003CCE12A8
MATPGPQQPSFAELEQAALADIAIYRSMPEFANARLAIIGSLSLWKHLRQYRTTNYVDFLMTVENAPNSFFIFRSPGGKNIKIDVVPKVELRQHAYPRYTASWRANTKHRLVPYVPTAAVPIATIQPGQLPHLSELNLLVFKVYSCSHHFTSQKKNRDANDAMNRMGALASRGPIVLTPAQIAAVAQGLDDIVHISGRGRTWWKSKLGLQ